MKHDLLNATINFEMFGEGYPIVFLHAMGTDHRSMLSWTEDVFLNQQGWRRIYIDLPGHGKTSMNPYVKTSDEIRDLLCSFLNGILGDEPFALVGMSFGGYIAQGILQQLRKQISGVCLIAPPLHLKERRLPPKTTLERDETLVKKLDMGIRNGFETLMVTQTQDTLERFLTEIQPGRLLADHTFLTSSWRTEGYYFSSDPLAGEDFSQPALIVLGRQDHLCGYEDQFQLLMKFPHSTYAVLDRAGHIIPVDQRYLLQSLAAEWLDRIKLSQLKDA